MNASKTRQNKKIQCSLPKKTETQIGGPFTAKELLVFAGKLLTSYQPSQVTPTTHLEQFIATDLNSTQFQLSKDENACLFLEELFYGLERHKEALQLVVDGFYCEHGIQVQATDKTLFTIIFFLCIFASDSLDFANLKKFIYANDPEKMLLLLKFLFEKHIHSCWLRDKLSAVYDHLYVENTITQKLQSIQPNVNIATNKPTIGKDNTWEKKI
ncbi:hypothetical protein RFI_08147 [Reticulomyxa filosa]|uniref:Uncharacterized protein n=1 Tax=Reticulomyxa filosa TaxID=46433 RepID=X6NRS3_RETFI|nr:hypothetical protein RFI_08147 [Reticulomyxa filosa]|eukprot:ETO28980.1 hypothetical protein RFI_08147 [Reticulomyxa filosa]